MRFKLRPTATAPNPMHPIRLPNTSGPNPSSRRTIKGNKASVALKRTKLGNPRRMTPCSGFDWLANRAPFLPPFFNSISVETRQLFQDRSADPSWRTRLLPPSPIDPIRSSRLVLDLVPLMKPRPTSSLEQPPAGYVTRLVSRVPMIRLPRNPLWWAGLLGLFGGLMGRPVSVQTRR